MPLQLFRSGWRLRLPLSVLLALLLIGAMAAIGASGNGPEHAMMTGIVTGDAADHGTLQAALGLG
jgi:hypothetical protein